MSDKNGVPPRHFGSPDPIPVSARLHRGDCTANAALSRRRSTYAHPLSQTGGDTVDAKMNGLNDALVALATAMALEQLDLDVMQRVDIRKPVAYRACEQRIPLQ